MAKSTLSPGDFNRRVTVLQGSLLGLVATLCSATVFAAQWYYEPQAQIRMELNDNKRLTPAPHNSVIGGIVDGAVVFATETETTKLSVRPGVRIERFSDNGDGLDLDSENYFFDVDASHTLERITLGGTFRYARENTIFTEIDNFGRVAGSNLDRNRISVQPFVTYLLSERDSIRLGGGYTEVIYEDPEEATFFTDSHVFAADLGWFHQLSAAQQVNFTLFAYRFEPDRPPAATATTNFGIRTDNLGFRLGYEHSVSETLSFGASAGLIYSDIESFIDGENSSDTQLGYLADIFATRRFAASEVRVGYSRTVNPTSDGRQNERDQVYLDGDHDFSERLFARLRYRFDHYENQGGVIRNGDSSDYHTAEAGIGWRLSPYWIIDGSYRYQSLDQENGIGADSNAVIFSLAYRAEKRAISR